MAEQKDSIDNLLAQTAQAAQATQAAQDAAGFQVFEKSRLSRVVKPYFPTGSFDALREQGKLVDARTKDGEEARMVMKNMKSSVPGYTGFLRGGQHVAGRTFGDTTRMAYSTQFEDLVRRSPIPSGPNANRKIEQAVLEDTFVSNNLSDHKQVPGYTGHVPGIKDRFGTTYGSMTKDEMANFAAKCPRVDANYARPGFADTTKPRHLSTINSNPLPGLKDNKMPILLVEHFHKTLQYRH